MNLLGWKGNKIASLSNKVARKREYVDYEGGRKRWSFTLAGRLDDIDRRILRELQNDGRVTNLELSRRVGISPPPCLRRVRALRKAGYIKGYRALLESKLL